MVGPRHIQMASRKASRRRAGGSARAALTVERFGRALFPSGPGRRAGRSGWSRRFGGRAYAITEMSAPLWSSCMAAVCRRICGVRCLSFSDGQCRAAVAACLVSSQATASVLNGRPRGVGNTGSVGPQLYSCSQVVSVVTVWAESGVARSLRPLPCYAERWFMPSYPASGVDLPCGRGGSRLLSPELLGIIRGRRGRRAACRVPGSGRCWCPAVPCARALVL